MNFIDKYGIRRIVREALKEDQVSRDITTRLIIPRNLKKEALIVAKESGIICGMNIARMVFKCVDDKIKFKALVKDGRGVKKGDVLAKLYGSVSSILSGERVALNFLGMLSGISTRANQFARKANPYKVKILDTRKTIPGLRALEKYAVRIGGGFNHRFSLADMVLIKENHLQIAKTKDIKETISNIRERLPTGVKIEVETRNLNEFKKVLLAGPDVIMLDNMSPEHIKEAVRLKKNSSIKIKRNLKLEASGNIDFKNIVAYCRTGIDFISLGTLTKDIKSLDVSLDIE